MRKTLSHGTADQMIDAFEQRISILEGEVNASTDIKASARKLKKNRIETKLDDSDDWDYFRYIDSLTSAVNDELDDLDILDSWTWEDEKSDLVLTTVKDSDIQEYRIPHADLSMDESSMQEDIEYIMKAVTEIEDDSIKSATKVSAGKEVEVYDDGTAYVDEQGSFGEPGEVYTMEDIRIMWNSMCNDDWCMEQYSSFDDWWRDTKRWLKETTSACANVTGSDDFAYDWEINGTFEKIASKQVPDSDGFYTDYTMYQNLDTGEYVFVFGDRDYYSPEDGNYDYECDSEDEAWEWYNSYNGFDDEDDIYSSAKVNASTSVTASGYGDPYGLADVKKYLNGKLEFYGSEIEMDLGDGLKLAKYLRKQGKPIMYCDGQWEIPDKCHWGDCYFYPYDWNTEYTSDAVVWDGNTTPDDGIDASCKVEGMTWDTLPHEQYGDDLTPMFDDCYYDVIDAGYTDDGQVIVTLNHRVDDIESAAQVLESVLEANGMHVSDWNVNGSNVFIFDWIDDYAHQEMQEADNDIYSSNEISDKKEWMLFNEVGGMLECSDNAHDIAVAIKSNKFPTASTVAVAVDDEIRDELPVDMWMEEFGDDSTFSATSIHAEADVPFDNSIPANYYYITKHGMGPGMLPKDVEINYIQDLPNGLTSFYLDRFLTTQELNEYDIYPETHDIYTQYPDWIRQASETSENEMYDDWQMGKVGRFSTNSATSIKASLIDRLPEEGWCLPYTMNEQETQKVDEIANRFCTSAPVSGDWDTELQEEMMMIGQELAIDEKYVNYIMINYLGFDPDEIKAAWSDISTTYYDMMNEQGMSEDDILNTFASMSSSSVLTDDQKAELWDMAEGYGPYSPEAMDTAVEQESIAKHFGITMEQAKQVMIDELGFDEDMFESDITSSTGLDDQEVPCPYCTMPTSREVVRKYGMCWDCYDNNVE